MSLSIILLQQTIYRTYAIMRIGTAIDSYHNVFGDSLVSVLLYGSCARGDYDEYSDVDIAAIVKGERLVLHMEEFLNNDDVAFRQRYNCMT